MAEYREEKEEKKVLISRELADDYPLYIQVSLTVTLLIFIALFLFVKSVKIKPYHPKTEIAVMAEQITQQLEEYKEPPPPPKPKLPVQVEEASSEEEAQQEEEEIEFSPTTEFNELQAPPPPAPETTYQFYAVEVKPKVVKAVEPVYPEIARKAGIEGRVFVKVLIGEDGHVIKAEVVRSTNKIFEKAALEAAKQFVFKPGMQRDRPVKVWMVLPFHFTLER